MDTVYRDNEEALIGCVLKGGLPVYQRVKDIVKAEYFGNTSYGDIWRVFENLFDNGLGIDTITVGDELERAGKLDQVGSGSRIGRGILSDMRMMGDPRNAESYAENVQDYFVKKQLDEVGAKMVYWARNGRRAADIMKDVSKVMGEFILYSNKAQDHVYDLAKMASLAYDETAEASRGKIRTVHTGLLDLDVMLNGGLRKGHLVIEAARPGQGKTALLATVVRNLIKSGGRALLFELEMTAVEIMFRILSQETEIPLDRIITGKLTPDEWGKYNDAIDYFAQRKDAFIVIDLPALKIGNIRQLARREMARQSFDLLGVDYIQLANADNKNERRQLDVGEVSRGLKALAKELDVPVLAAAQLSREVEGRADKRPVLKDLREAGDLENDADEVIFIYRPDQYEKETEKQNTADLIVAKHRNGQVGTVTTIYRAPLTRFENAAVTVFRPNE